ncbi:30S ribosomal protein S20 [Falsigemmobacter faecalis]|uniref:Small ribosomal subunit protein bS20 n=1 Tax=Falsigemmobacter faecalis TaxID=2488730 RepID=A0A3P3DT11_9RHOB|nr:30S ribosomal protein S20 [Falsigemmobacter faecalis]RRH76672.1 30S ribosomal protein S20 [Falsigemmobacter faecalis]
MANTKQSEKRARQSEARFAVNKARRSRVRTYVRKLEEAIASGDVEAVKVAFAGAQTELTRAVSKGLVHKNTVSRKISRLNARVKAVAVKA